MIYDAIVNIVAKNVDKIPATINGAKNPVFLCDGTYNTHVCDSRCKTEKYLACSDPHHKSPAEHYPGSNPICWEPCGYTDPNDPNNPHAHKEEDVIIDGVTKKAGKFLNIDYGFQVYFPNTGDFEDDPTLRGIGAVTQVKGMNYKNKMDTTKWLREKRIKFGFDVLFYNPTSGKWEEYKANTWIPLPILKDASKFDTDYSEFSDQEWFKEHALEVYDFYVTLSNVDIAAARYDFEVEAVNAEHSTGGKSAIYNRKVVNRTEERNIDNTTNASNSVRNNALSAKHSASKYGFTDIVGRIGNLLITDTDDIRFANLFKLPVDGTWLIDGVVKGVNSGVQNNYLSWHTNSGGRWLDIRGVQVTPEYGMYNTWMTENWAEDKEYAAKHGSIIGSTDVPLPLTSDKNNVTQLLADMFKPGYNILYEISTAGSYSDNLQVIPYFYALDTKLNKLYPIDVYMKEEDEYVPINYYDVLPKSSDSDSEKAKKQKLIDEEHKYVLSLDWAEEKERRNYTTQEKLITNYITDNYNYLIDKAGTRHKLNSPDTIIGTGHALGTVQLINADQYARTFIGSTYTRGEKFNSSAVDDSNTGIFKPISVGGGEHYTNLDNIIYRDHFWSNAQRWHLKLGLPSTAVFIKYDKDGIRHLPTEELVDESGNPIVKDGGEHKLKYEELQDKRYAIIMTAEIYAYGDTYTLKYDQGTINGKAKIGNKTYTFGNNYNGQEIKGTILSVYDAEGSSDLDVTIRGSH